MGKRPLKRNRPIRMQFVVPPKVATLAGGKKNRRKNSQPTKKQEGGQDNSVKLSPYVATFQRQGPKSAYRGLREGHGDCHSTRGRCGDEEKRQRKGHGPRTRSNTVQRGYRTAGQDHEKKQKNSGSRAGKEGDSFEVCAVGKGRGGLQRKFGLRGGEIVGRLRPCSSNGGVENWHELRGPF